MRTLALNMIVGPGDAALLDRCAKAFEFKKLFDEIVIAVTTEDAAVAEMAKSITDNVVSHKWTNARYPYGNFGAARNAALRETKSDFVMWLDCDDLPSEGFVDLFPSLRKVLDNKFDVYNMRYKITDTEHTVRERIFRRRADLFWIMPAHEQIPVNPGKHEIATLSNVHIVHAPDKISEVSVARNLRILEHEHECNPTPHIGFYFAKELYHVDARRDASVDMMRKIVSDKQGTTDLVAQACLMLAMHYVKYEKYRDAETYARIGMGYNENYPAFYRILGDIYKERNDANQSLAMYRKAVDCSFNGGGVCNSKERMYSASQVALAVIDKSPEIALHYAKISGIDDLYRVILERLNNKWQPLAP